MLRVVEQAPVQPALLAPSEKPAVKVAATDKKKAAAIELATRRDATHLYLIAVRRGGTAQEIRFSGLPRKRDGTPMKKGEVLFEYIQWPTPKALKKLEKEHKPLPTHEQVLRPVMVKNGGFNDCFRPHDVHVYRFEL